MAIFLFYSILIWIFKFILDSDFFQYLSNRISNVGNNKVHRRCSSYPEKTTKDLHKRISDSSIQCKVSLPPPVIKPSEESGSPGHKRTRSLIGIEEVKAMRRSLPCLKRSPIFSIFTIFYHFHRFAFPYFFILSDTSFYSSENFLLFLKFWWFLGSFILILKCFP